MAGEAVKALEEADVRPTHVFLQAGVGAMAGGVCGYLMNHYREGPLSSALWSRKLWPA